MSTVPRRPSLPLLENGDRLSQAEFHRRYEAYPEDVKAELIGGIVYMASPLRRSHAVQHPELSGVFWLYKAATPGVEVLDKATTILDESKEPQPDLALRILPQWGGRSRTNQEDYVVGAPELLSEIAHSSHNIDLHQKRHDYRRAGVVEYMVVCLEERELFWFDFSTGKDIRPNRQGIRKSRVFPGLWIDETALLDRDSSRLIAVVQQGLAHRSHAAFVKRLQATQRK
jgi:hypothetical protein